MLALANPLRVVLETGLTGPRIGLRSIFDIWPKPQETLESG